MYCGSAYQRSPLRKWIFSSIYIYSVLYSSLSKGDIIYGLRNRCYYQQAGNDICDARDRCEKRRLRNARRGPSQTMIPHIPSPLQSTLFKAVFSYLFDHGGHHDLEVWDRISGWVKMIASATSTDAAAEFWPTLLSQTAGLKISLKLQNAFCWPTLVRMAVWTRTVSFILFWNCVTPTVRL